MGKQSILGEVIAHTVIQMFKFEKIQITINKLGNLIPFSKRSFLARLQYKNLTLL